MRGATQHDSSAGEYPEFLLTRPMRGATTRRRIFGGNWSFLLTRPMRGATILRIGQMVVDGISTHTPHAGRDSYI